MSTEFVLTIAAYIVAAIVVVYFFRNLPHGERQEDPPPVRQSFRFRLGVAVQRANPIVTAFTVAIIVCSFPLLLVLFQQDRMEQQDKAIQESRGEAVALVCDQNRIMRDFIEAEPDYPRDAVALEALRQERCDELLREIEATTGQHFDRYAPERRRR
jgi:hypothetical protein